MTKYKAKKSLKSGKFKTLSKAERYKKNVEKLYREWYVIITPISNGTYDVACYDPTTETAW